MAASSSSVRQVLASSQHTLARKASVASAGRRRISASAMSLPIDEQAPLELPQIFDIFDAPSRLGESSKLLARASAPRAERTPASSERTPVRTIKPMPAPVVYDGPARPSHLHNASRVRRVHMQALPSSGSKENISTLPSPIVFDGPSRLRPYCRGGAQEDSSSTVTLLIAAGAAGTLAYAAYDQLTQNTGRQRTKSNH